MLNFVFKSVLRKTKDQLAYNRIDEGELFNETTQIGNPLPEVCLNSYWLCSVQPFARLHFPNKVA